MVKTFSVDDNNDIFIGTDGNLSISYDLEAVLQICSQVVRVRLGEVVLDTSLGIPFFETVWDGVPNIMQFESAVRAALLQVDGVVEVVSFRTARSNNALTYTAIIRTIYGEGPISGGL